jgi:hypothetical protein
MPESAFHVGTVSAVSTAADARIITERSDPHQAGRSIICSEPSPDVAKAFSSIAALGATTPRGGIQGAYGQGEAVASLAGRTATAVALRDSLFRACEAYANGLIGRDAYSLILSHYPDLLVTLMLGETAQSDAVKASSADAAADIGSEMKKATGGGAAGKGLDQSISGVSVAASAKTAATNDTDGKPNSAAAQIAQLYFASREARGDAAVFVVCLTEAEDAIRQSRPFPDPTRNNFIDRMCAAALEPKRHAK